MTNDSGGSISYAERLRTNINFNQRLQRNVLEITLEKTESTVEVDIDQSCITRIMKSLGMDLNSQVEGCQVQFNGRSHVVSIWAAKGINLEKYCRAEGINVCKGIMTGNIQPAGRKDVIVTVKGLDFNTPDSLLFDYIQKFGGEIVNKNVVYSKFTDGPLKGKYNGDRKYQIDFSNSTLTMGTYHFLDGAKVRIFYRGNERTCGRCHGNTSNCKGGGIAKECEAAGGTRVPLHQHMKKLWKEINFTPASFELPGDLTEDLEHDVEISSSQNFPRAEKVAQVTEKDMQRYVGLSIANINLDEDDSAIQDFVRRFVSSEIPNDQINIIRDKKKAVVNINDTLTSETVSQAMKRLNFSDCKQKYFEKPLYCKPLRNMTPEKSNNVIPGLQPKDQEKASAFQIMMAKPNKKDRDPKNDPESDQSSSPQLREKRSSNEMSSPSSPQEQSTKKGRHNKK